jgi:hypothetical protein
MNFKNLDEYNIHKREREREREREGQKKKGKKSREVKEVFLT